MAKVKITKVPECQDCMKGGYTQSLIGNITNPSYYRRGGKKKPHQMYPFQNDQGMLYSDQGDQSLPGNPGMPETDMGGIITAIPYKDVNTFINQKMGGEMKKGGRFMGIHPSHKGYCTPMSKSTCTGRRRALALTLKKHHGFHDQGGEVDFVDSADDFKSGGIHIDPSKRGTFKTQANKMGMSVQAAASHIMAHKDNYSPGMVKKAVFAHNFAKEDGGIIDELKKGGWLKGAVNPSHKGWCTPLSNPHCTGHRRAFALMMKKKHGFHKEGGPTPAKAAEMLHDGTANGHPLTAKQKRYFGYLQSLGKKEFGGTHPEFDTLSGVYKYKKGGKYIGTGPNTDLNPTTNSSIEDYNPYIYFKDKNWYITSNPEDENITQSVKPIDRQDANIEAEKGEYIVKPGLSGLYRIGGKKHSQGGTPLYADGGSFIFSNDPKLAINRKEKQAFGFKEGGSNAYSKNTPAKVLSREVNPKEYNSYIATLEDPRTDKIAKTTASLMLEKLQQKLGQVAYLQEVKKGSQAPDFSQGTAPVHRPEFNDIDERMSEYGSGGYYYPWGGPIQHPLPGTYAYSNTPQGGITPTGFTNNFNYPTGFLGEDNTGLYYDWLNAGVDATKYKTAGDYQGAMYDWALKNNPSLLRDMWSTYGITNKGKSLGLDNIDTNNLSDQDLSKLRSAYTDNLIGQRVFGPFNRNTNPSLATPHTVSNPLSDVSVANNYQQLPTIPPALQGTQGYRGAPTLPYDIKGKLTDQQIMHLGYLGLQAFNINKYYPKRQQVSLPNVRLDQISAQPQLNQINNQAYVSNQLAALNPRTASLLNSNVRGAAIDQANQVLGNVANQNVQIANMQNQYNTQQMTQQVMANNEYDTRYHDLVNATRQNYDNERRFASNQFMNTLNQYKSQDDQLAWALASVNKYGVRQVRDPKTGQVYNLPVPLYEVTNRGIQYNADVANINMASMANRINTPQEALGLYNILSQGQGMTPQLAERFASSIIRAHITKGGQGNAPFYMQNPYGAY